MPSIVSHTLLGQRICHDRSFVANIPQFDQTAFLWGCQGPDILFYHRILPWQTGSIRWYGGKLHNGDPTKLLESMAKICRYCRKKPCFSQIYSYALGVCCHYCYDRRLHPLVYYNCELLEKTDERGGRYYYHSDVESNLDIMLLRHDTGQLMNEIRLTDCLPECEGLTDSIAMFYALLLCDLFGIHTPHAAAASITKDFKTATALMDDAYTVKKPLAAAAEELLPYFRRSFRKGSLTGLIHSKSEDMGFDYGNLLGNTWFNPSDRSERSNLNFYELTDIAQAETMQLMALFADETAKKGSVNFALFTHGINFSGRKVEGEITAGMK